MTTQRFSFDASNTGATTAASVFRDGNYASLLMESLTPGGWARLAKQLIAQMEAEASVVLTAGSMTIDYFMVNGRYVDFMPLNVAEEAVTFVSEGRLELVLKQAIGLYDQPSLHLQATAPLQREAFKQYTGSNSVSVYRAGGVGGVEQVHVRDLINSMASFRNFFTDRTVYRNNMMRAFRARMGRPEVTQAQEHAKLLNRIESEKRFAEYLAKIQSGFTSVYYSNRGKVFPHIALLPHGTISSRRWGIEIEAVDIEGIETPEGWELHDDGSLRGVSQEDGGCDCGYCEDETTTETGEWTSPILNSFHSRGLEHLTDALTYRESNDTPGIHVHVDAADLTPMQAARVALIYTAWEPLFEVEYNRDEREYCESLSPEELIERFRAARKVSKATAIEVYDRYNTVNLAALSAHGTIEFRAMGPRYQYETLIKWASFLREIVNIARADVPQRVWASVTKFEDIIGVFQRYGKETPGAEIVELEVPVEQAEGQGVEPFVDSRGYLTHSYNDDYSGDLMSRMQYA